MNDEKTFAHKLYGAVRTEQETGKITNALAPADGIKEEEKQEITQTETIKE